MSTTSSTSAATTTTGSTTSIATVITDAGFAMLRAAPGHKLVYTRAVCGSGHVDKTQLATLTEISDYVMDLSIVEFGPSESSATLRLQLDNSKAPKEFQLHQIGVCAKLLDGEEELIGETLIQVMQYEEPDIVRAVPHVSEFIVNVLVGQAETVEGVIDMAAYVSIRQFSGRTVNGKPLSADVVLSGEDIKVSPDDETTIKAALSNKAEKYTKLLGIPPQTWEEVWALEPGVYSWVQLEPITGWQPTDTPTGALRVELTIHGTELHYGSRSLVLAYIDGATYLKRYVGEHGEYEDRLTLIATATPPQEYNLPLTGVSDVGNGNSRYSKDQFGEVICQISVTPGADIPSYTILATLPEGFRPKKSVSVPAMIAIDGTRAMGQIGVNSSGEIGYYGATVTAGENSRIYASFSFVADANS